MQQPFKDELLFNAFYTFFKRKWLILWVFLLIFCAVLFMVALMTPRYEGTSQVMVDLNPRYQAVLFPDFAQPSGRMPAIDPNQNLVEVLTSREMAAGIVKNFGLDKLVKERRLESTAMRDVVKRFASGLGRSLGGFLSSLGIGGEEEEKTDAWWFDEAVDEFLDDWNRVEIEKETSVINVTVLGTDPEISRRISSSMVERLGDALRDAVRERFDRVKDFVARNIAAARAKLDAANEALKEFQEKRDPSFVEKERDQLLARRESLRSGITDAAAARAGAAKRLAELRNRLEGQKIRVPTTEEVEGRNPTVALLKSDLAKYETDMAALSLELKEDHPARRELAEKIRSTRERLAGEVKADFQSRTRTEEFNPLYVQAVLQAAEALSGETEAAAREAALKAEEAQAEGRLAALSRELADLNKEQKELERRAAVAENYYLSLKQRSLELDALSGNPEGEYDLKVIDPAHNPDGDEVSTPEWNLVLPVACVVALLFALFAAFFLEYWRNTYREPWELEAETGVPVLATVPRIGKAEKKS